MHSGPLLLADYDYPLPDERIAQNPPAERGGSRLCVLNRGKIEHRRFADIADYFKPGDCLVVNDTRVLPARLHGKRKSGGRVEVFLLEHEGDDRWSVLGKPSRGFRQGEELLFDRDIRCTVLDAHTSDDKRRVQFSAAPAKLYAVGTIPLPPYIRRDADDNDRDRYQTVFARADGAVAAPTAGLHFTPELLDRIRAGGVEVVSVTLHVGLGTFRPVITEDVTQHRMEREAYRIPAESADAVLRVKARGGRVFAAGTTTVRALETAARLPGGLSAGSGHSELFIRPPFEFKVVDALITNFHVPRSTLLLLVSAFAGHGPVMALYREALREGYRFLSYGDATLFL